MERSDIRGGATARNWGQSRFNGDMRDMGKRMIEEKSTLTPFAR